MVVAVYLHVPMDLLFSLVLAVYLHVLMELCPLNQVHFKVSNGSAQDLLLYTLLENTIAVAQPQGVSGWGWGSSEDVATYHPGCAL